MTLPTVVHPKVINAAGYRLQLVTHFPVTDQEATLIATACFRQRRWLKKDLGKTFQIHWVDDRSALATLEAASAAATETLQSLRGPKAGSRRR
jgi:hypothetical protein